MEDKKKYKLEKHHLFLLPKNAVREFNLDKDSMKSIRRDFATNALLIEGLISIVVSGVILFYMIQSIFVDGLEGYWPRFFSIPQSAVAQLVFLGSSLALQLYLLVSYTSKKERPHWNRFFEDFYAMMLTLGMLSFFANDATTQMLNKSRTISPSILWISVICFCPIAYYTDQLVISGTIGASVIVSAVVLNNKYGVNEIHQYFLVGTIYVLVSYMFHSIFFYVECQKHFIENKNEKLMLSSNYDALTYCWNRNGLMAFTSKYENRNSPFPTMLMMFDIDHFKLFNDTYSHLEGDKVLRGVVQAIKEQYPNEELKFARWGGDEFVLLMDVKNSNDAVNQMEKIRKAVYDLKISGLDNKIKISISVGGCFTKAGVRFNLEDTIKEADRCLYVSKKAGRNRSCIDGLLVRP